NVGALITHTFPINDAPRAYELITGKERFVGVLLKYPETVGQASRLSPRATGQVGRVFHADSAVVLGVIGAGNYAQGVLLPQFNANADVTLHTVCTASGVNAKKVQEKFRFAGCTTDW